MAENSKAVLLRVQADLRRTACQTAKSELHSLQSELARLFGDRLPTRHEQEKK